MGLQATVSIQDLDLPLTVYAEFASETIDYSEAINSATETFLSQAKSLVPVDTGFLQQSIRITEITDTSFTVEASADYAQYVEYGTIKMYAQPYFIPALAAALRVLQYMGYQIQQEAQNRVNELSDEFKLEQEKEQNKREFNTGNLSLNDTIESVLFAAALYIILFPILVNVYGIIETLKTPLEYDRKINANYDTYFFSMAEELTYIV